MTEHKDAPRPPQRLEEGRRFREVFDLREWARVCSAHIWWIVLITAAVVLGTGVTSFTATEYYRATQRILIERESDKVLDVNNTYQNDGANPDYFLTQYKLLESRAVAELALESLTEADRDWFARAKDPVGLFMKLRSVVPIRKSRLVDIHAEHPDPKVAEFMAQALYKAYVRHNEQRRRESVATSAEQLREDARTLKTRLLEASQSSQRYKAEHGILAISDRQTLPEFRLQSLHKELAAIERELSDSDSRLESADAAMRAKRFTTDLPEVLQNAVISESKLEFLAANATLSRLSKKYKDQHPQIVEQKSKVESIAKLIDREVRAVHGALRHANSRLHRHKSDLEARIAKQNKLLYEQDRHRVRYDQLVAETKNVQELYDSVAKRLEEVEVIADYATSNVHAVGAPVVSSRPIRPRPLAAMAIALLAGLLLGLLSAFALDAMDSSLKSGIEAEQTLGQPVLGLVPRVRGPGQLAVDDRALDPDSNVAEAFRSIRTRLLLSPQAQRPRSLVVTSTGAGEGKSLVALCLATAFARAGQRVLLVDAEMRRPRLHEALNIQSVEGFSSVLIGERRVEHVAFETDEDNLFFMPCGVLPPNPLELLTIGMTAKVRRDLEEYFDLVIFDSPPVGIVSDACMLAATADQVLFVVRTFRADRTQALRAIKTLESSGAHVGGLIVNHADHQAERGRQLDFTYETNYSSLPVTATGTQSRDEGLFDNDDYVYEDADDEFAFQLTDLESELEDAISNLSQEEDGGLEQPEDR